jgi:hypothetical protein
MTMVGFIIAKKKKKKKEKKKEMRPCFQETLLGKQQA